MAALNLPLNYVHEVRVTTRGAAGSMDATGDLLLNVYEGSSTTALAAYTDVVMTNVGTGDYRTPVTLSTANGFVVGNLYHFRVSGTVDGIPDKIYADKVQVVAAVSAAGVPKVDASHVAGTAQTAGDIPAKTNSLTFTVANQVDSNALSWGGTTIVATSIPVATAAGASGGLLRSGVNSGTTTFGAINVSGTTTFSGIVNIAEGVSAQKTTGSVISIAAQAGNGSAISIAGIGSGNGIIASGGATGAGIRLIGGATSGAALRLGNTSGSTLDVTGTIAVSGLTTFESFTITNALTVGTNLLPWNAAWDAEVQSEVADALTAFGVSTQTSVDDLPTVAEFEARTLVAADYATATALTSLVTTVGVAGAGLTAADDAVLAAIAAMNNLSAAQVNAEVLDVLNVDTLVAGRTFAEALRRIGTITSGKVSGAGSGIETFTDWADSAATIVITVDASGNRASITYN